MYIELTFIIHHTLPRHIESNAISKLSLPRIVHIVNGTSVHVRIGCCLNSDW